MKRIKWRTALSYLFVTVLLSGFGIYLAQNATRYRDLFIFSTRWLVLLVALILASIVSNGLINVNLYRALNAPLTVNEGIGLGVINTLANQLPFAGGLIAKGVYLKQRHALAYERFLSATGALYVCFVAVNGLVGLAVMTFLVLTSETQGVLPIYWGFLAMAASSALLWIPTRAIDLLPSKWKRRLEEMLSGWQILSRDLLLVGGLVGLQTAATVVSAGRFWIAFHALSQDVTYAQCLLFSSATILTRLVNIVPGGLGVREGIVAGVASTLGFEPEVSAVAVGLDRVVSTSVIIVLGIVYTYILSKKAANAAVIQGGEG
jgi:uncharacterized membrane protein YbhN (UPF0104 family)